VARQTKLESVVVDEIIGGISNLYNDNDAWNLGRTPRVKE
jgi:hypothetical protein